MNTPTKNRNRCCEKTRRDVLKTAEATGDQVGNKIADKIISVGKTKRKEKKMKKMKQSKFTYHQRKEDKLLTL